MTHDEEANDKRFLRGEEKAADMAERVSVLEDQMEMVKSDLYNSGRDGLKTRMVAFMARYDAIEAERERADKRWRWFVGVMLSVIIGLASLWIALDVNRQAKAGLIQGTTDSTMATTQTSDWRH